MAGYFQHALTGSDGKIRHRFLNSTALIRLLPQYYNIIIKYAIFLLNLE